MPEGSTAGPGGGDLDALRAELIGIGRVAVVFSGGADSAFLAWVATQTLDRENVLCVTAVSPSLAPEELADCRALAAEWDLRHLEVATRELADPAYSANDGSRCYHCKATLMEALEETCARGARAAGADGTKGTEPPRGPWCSASTSTISATTAPGRLRRPNAAREFPLVDAGFTKDAVRSCSRQLGLRTWDKPAAACLASRVPYGTPVTLDTLRSVADAESALRSLGFRQVRVRHYGETARIELPTDDLAAAIDRREEISLAVHGAGYRYVTLDLDGFRSGNLNVALAGQVAEPEAVR